MITGAHLLFFSENPEADRAFFRDVLKFRSVELGGGWLIFALPPAEAGIHPIGKDESRGRLHAGHSLVGAVMYLMCDDLAAEMKRLASSKVEFSPVETAEWGTTTTIRLPSGGELGLYQPSHPTAIGGKMRRRAKARPKQRPRRTPPSKKKA